MKLCGVTRHCTKQTRNHRYLLAKIVLCVHRRFESVQSKTSTYVLRCPRRHRDLEISYFFPGPRFLRQLSMRLYEPREIDISLD